MSEPHGNFDDVMRNALEEAGIKDSRREVSRRISDLRILIGADYWKMKQDNERRDAENARCRKR